MYRTDNKKSQIHNEIFFFILVFSMFIMNILNTQKAANMYAILAITLAAIVGYAITYSVFVKINKNDLKLEDKYLAFYVSGSTKNTLLKLITVLFDSLSLLGILFTGFYYFYKIDFINVYPEYLIILLAFLAFLQLLILIKDINKINTLDRIDALSNKHTFSILDKKLTFAATAVMICVLNILMLSFKKPHFIVQYNDLVIFELIALITQILLILSILTTRLYYKTYNLKQIEQKEFNTKFLEEIGKGSFATVYKAYLPSLDNIYAIKKLDSIEPTNIERFDNEFKLMKSLSHPNILSVYSYDEIKYEYIMDYMPNTLYEFMDKEVVSNPQKLDLIRQLLDGFEYLHKHNILHRDISYNNIMVKQNPYYKDELTLKIVDFGTSRKLTAKRMTKTNAHATTTIDDPTLKSYKEYNIQNDIYAIGIIINYISSKGEDLNNEIIKQIVNKCVDLNLELRYQTVSEIKQDFNQMEVL